MLEESKVVETDAIKQERQTLRTEIGKLIVSHLYIERTQDGKDGRAEAIDDLEIQDDEDVDYELRMGELMEKRNSMALTANKRLLEPSPPEDLSSPRISARSLRAGAAQPAASPTSEDAAARASPRGVTAQLPGGVQTMLDMKEDNLLFKAEKG